MRAGFFVTMAAVALMLGARANHAVIAQGACDHACSEVLAR
jgi:hypothetical protein